MKPVAAIAAAVAVLLLVAACTAPADPKTDNVVRVVATTSVYGDVAETVGGADVEVTSIIEDTDRDPHDFEPDAQSQLAVAKADLIVLNGGGYDPFIDPMIDASRNASVAIVDAVALSRHDPSSATFNEHVWYDLPTMITVARAIGERLGTVDPDNASNYADRAEDFVTDIEALRAAAADLELRYAGSGIVATESVPLYLLQSIGLIDSTPAGFSAAIEDDRDVSPVVLQETIRLIESGDLAFLAYNEQTGGPQTDALLAAAEVGAVPVVRVTETLPVGIHYVRWMGATIDAIADALAMRG